MKKCVYSLIKMLHVVEVSATAGYPMVLVAHTWKNNHQKRTPFLGSFITSTTANCICTKIMSKTGAWGRTLNLTTIEPVVKYGKTVRTQAPSGYTIKARHLQAANVMSYLSVAHECALLWVWLWSCGVSSAGDGGASFLGGMRSLMASKPLASAKLVILWLGENPCNAAHKKNNQISSMNESKTHHSWGWSCRRTAPRGAERPLAWDPWVGEPTRSPPYNKIIVD